MIFTHLMGGLGNQMFQYAAGRALALRLNAELRIDTSYYKSDFSRVVELDRFNLDLRPMTAADKAMAARWQRRSFARWARITRRLGRPFGVVYLDDIEKGVLEDFFSIEGDVYLWGFWQSVRYFAPISEVLLKDFTFRMQPDERNLEIIEQMQDTPSIVLHVRRGDYVNNAKAARYHGTCDLDYYERAVREILGRVAGPHFFVFSDDPEWTQENIRVPAPSTYVTHNSGERAFEDLRLMSQGKHFILANSSFSWWGAWLSQNPGKQVIAPKRWFADENIPASHIPLPDWTLF